MCIRFFELKYSVGVSKLCIVEAPTASNCFVELDKHKPPITRGLGKRKFSRIEKPLSLQNLVVAGQPTPIPPICDRHRFSQGPNLVLLLFLDIAQLLRCDQGVRYFLKSPQRTLRILQLGLIEDGLGCATLLCQAATCKEGRRSRRCESPNVRASAGQRR